MRMLRSFPILLFCAQTLASSCQPQPFAVPITDVQVEPTIPDSFMRGIAAKVGSPEQNIVLAPWAELNNTWVYDGQTYCDPTVIFSDTICEVRRGNPFLEANSKSFAQSLDIIAAGGASQETDAVGSEAGIKHLVGSSLAGTDSFTLESSATISKFPLGIPRLAWDAGYTTLHALGLGSNSTYLNALWENGRIGARAWSVFWGRMWTTDNPLDGAVVFGGYDQRKIIGQNYTQALDYTSTGCWTGMRVNIANIFVNDRTGTDQSIFQANTALPVCIVPQRQLLIEVPGDIYGNFEAVTATQNIGVSFGLHWSAHLFDTGTQFDGDITILLDSGLSIRIPNDQYVVPFVSIGRNGSRFFNESQREVLIASVDQQPATLGRYFLTAAYLMVDHDAGSFTLWQANPSKESELVPVAAAKSPSNCSTSSDSSGNATSPPNPTPTPTPHTVSTGAIVGGAVGGFIGLTLMIGGIVWLKKRRRHRPRVPHAFGPAQECGFKYELPGNSSQRMTENSNLFDKPSVRYELQQTPKVPRKDLPNNGTGWTRTLYEME